ncbi:MAG: hypothetical protein LC132_03175 [Burkholderiales bacterium]|nr:hypothetical protein [Burkholderiales bacterium]
MEQIANIFVKSIFTENMIFAYFLGMCSYLAVSKTVKTASGLGLAVIFVLLITLPVNYLLDRYVLSPGALAWINPQWAEVDLGFLSFILFIAVIAAMVQLVEMVVEKFAPALYNNLGIFLPLIAVNCAILGASLFMQEREYGNILEVFSYALGSGIGWYLAIVSIAAREKLSYSNSGTHAWAGHCFHHYRAYGYCLYEFYGITNLNTTNDHFPISVPDFCRHTDRNPGPGCCFDLCKSQADTRG